MKTEIVESADEYVYRISGFSDCQRVILEASFFSDEGGLLTKRFPKNTLMFDHNIEMMAPNFEKYMEDQERRADQKERFEKALDWICSKHSGNSIRWWLCGSGALYARGLDVTPHDIDVMSYKSEISKISSIVKDHIVEPFHHVSGWVVKGFGVVSYNFRIDYAFEPEEWVDGNGPVDFGPAASNDLEEIEWKGHAILVPKVHFHLRSNQARDRLDIVEKIGKYMKEMNLTLPST